ncbi:hypothetical protein C8Q77DRAFT_260529 [Trametes polyzona]|nr:hypothetical protein C8Q77DRAFT_260529 [Trametes polyzona]
MQCNINTTPTTHLTGCNSHGFTNRVTTRGLGMRVRQRRHRLARCSREPAPQLPRSMAVLPPMANARSPPKTSCEGMSMIRPTCRRFGRERDLPPESVLYVNDSNQVDATRSDQPRRRWIDHLCPYARGRYSGHGCVRNHACVELMLLSGRSGDRGIATGYLHGIPRSMAERTHLNVWDNRAVLGALLGEVQFRKSIRGQRVVIFSS